MKILVVSQYFYPENFRINDLCKTLVNRGHEITVLTGLPNYPQGDIYKGYSFLGNNDEQWENIDIVRSKLIPRKKGTFCLLLNYISFVFFGNIKARKVKDIDFDLIYVYGLSPITLALPAIRIKKIKKIPLIINVQDLWPESVIAITGLNNTMILNLINKLVNKIYMHSDMILATSKSFVESIQQRVDNIDKVRYWPQYSIISNENSEDYMFDKNRFNIVFTGNLGEAQGLELAIESALILKTTKIMWHIIGDGRNKGKLEQMVKEYKLEENIKFYGFIKEIEITKYLASANAALIILKDNPVFQMTIPAKLQTYMSCGVPIIGCVKGEAERAVKEANAGIISSNVSVNGLVDVCRIYLKISGEQQKLFGLNAKKYAKKYFNKDSLLDELEKYMEELTV